MSNTSYDPSPEVPVQVTPDDELRARAARMQAIMKDAGLDGVMATQNADVFYLSGVIQQAQVYLPAVGQPLLMVRKHHGRAGMVSQLGPSQVVKVRSLRDLPGLILEAGGSAPRRIGFEWDTLPVSNYNAYAKALAGLGTELVDGSMIFKQTRAIKSPSRSSRSGAPQTWQTWASEQPHRSCVLV